MRHVFDGPRPVRRVAGAISHPFDSEASLASEKSLAEPLSPYQGLVLAKAARGQIKPADAPFIQAC